MSTKREFMKQLVGLAVAPLVPGAVAAPAPRTGFLMIDEVAYYTHQMWIMDQVTGVMREHSYRALDGETVEIGKGVACG